MGYRYQTAGYRWKLKAATQDVVSIVKNRPSHARNRGPSKKRSAFAEESSEVLTSGDSDIMQMIARRDRLICPAQSGGSQAQNREITGITGITT